MKKKNDFLICKVYCIVNKISVAKTEASIYLLFSLLDPWGDFLIWVCYDSLQGTQLLSQGKLQMSPNKEKISKVSPGSSILQDGLRNYDPELVFGGTCVKFKLPCILTLVTDLTARTHQSTHVFYQTKDSHSHLPAETNFFFNGCHGNILRRGD